MYGMIHKALQDFVTSAKGPEIWQAIASEAGVTNESFIAMQTYSDDVAYGLVGAAAKVLQAPAGELLEQFGRHWISFAADNGFRELLGGPGTSMPSFLAGLDAMHARINLSFPDSEPPTFETEMVGPQELHLHYRSHRPGLLPFVLGLLQGLSAHFDQPITVETVSTREQGHDHDTVLVAWEQR